MICYLVPSAIIICLFCHKVRGGCDRHGMVVTATVVTMVDNRLQFKKKILNFINITNGIMESEPF